MRRSKSVPSGGTRLEIAVALTASALVLGLTMFAVPPTAALFTADYPEAVTFETGTIFQGERVTPAFKVADHSAGTGSDASSPVAFAGDGRTFQTSAWPATFAAGRYVELRAERDVLCLISNCPQLNNPCNGYNPTPIEVIIWNP